MSKRSLLSRGGWFPLHRSVLSSLRDLEQAAVLHYLIDVENVLVERADIEEGGWFFCTVDRIEDQICVKRQRQKRILRLLAERGLIEIDYRGIPRRRYARIVWDAIWPMIDSAPSGRMAEEPENQDEVAESPENSSGPKTGPLVGTRQWAQNGPTGEPKTGPLSIYRKESKSKNLCIGSCAPDPQKAGGPGLGLTGKEGEGRFKAERPRPDISRFARTAAGKLRAAILRKQDGRALAAKTLAAEIDRLLRSPNNELDEARIKAAIRWGIKHYGEPSCGSIWRQGQVREQILKWDKQARFESMPSGRNGRKLNRVDVSTIDWSKV